LFAYQVDFLPGQLSPIRVKDGLEAELRPRPHISVGDPEAAGNGARVPLAARLASVVNVNGRRVARAKVYRDPGSGQIVLGADESGDGTGTSAIVLLSASTGFPDGVSIQPSKGLSVLAQGERGRVRQCLLIWPDGAGVTIHDHLRNESHELRRTGEDFKHTSVVSQP
jgi:hypothetical protein